MLVTGAETMHGLEVGTVAEKVTWPAYGSCPVGLPAAGDEQPAAINTIAISKQRLIRIDGGDGHLAISLQLLRIELTGGCGVAAFGEVAPADLAVGVSGSDPGAGLTRAIGLAGAEGR
jgi:hypothetical protein